jgi:hypothetical protein
MTRLILVCGLASLSASLFASSRLSALVISLPSTSNPPNTDGNARLFRGTAQERDQRGWPKAVDPVTALTEAALSCGQRRFQWRGLNTDHANQLLLDNSQAGRRTLNCIAGKVSFTFYAGVERISSH